MKIKNNILNIEIEWLFILTILISIFSIRMRNFLQTYYICYLFILFHELSHVFLAAIFGKKINELKLSLAGACAIFKYSAFNKNTIKDSIINVLIFSIGPISNLILAYIFRYNLMLFQINLFLAILNLVPIKPLDGYNIVLNLLDILHYILGYYFKIKNIMKFIEMLFLISISLLSVYQLICYKNPSVVIFIVYLFLIRNLQKNKVDIGRIISNIGD